MSLGRERIVSGKSAITRLVSVVLILALGLSLAIVVFPGTAFSMDDLNPEGSLPEVGKKINELIYPTFGFPAIRMRAEELTIEWDWRKNIEDAPRPAYETIDDPDDWQVWITSSVAANVQNYNGDLPGDPEDPPGDWYSYGGPSEDPYGYGTYQDPVHTVINARPLEVTGVKRGASEQWPEIFGIEDFEVDNITVKVPANVPLDLYDLHAKCVSDDVAPEFKLEDGQPHALQVIDGYTEDLKIVQITDTHMYGHETQNGWNLNFNTFELREPRPGTPGRDPCSFMSWDGFPLDNDGDGKTDEGAVYLQEQFQAINLIDPDFVVFTGDAVFAQKNWNTYPKDTPLWGEKPGDLGSEYRFEYTWWYDELLALNVPIFCVPGNHDSYCWDGHQDEGGLARDDGLEIWQDLFGPAYYSWDYGNEFFLAANSMDWPKQAEGFEPYETPNPDLIWLLISGAYPEFAQEWDDRNGFRVALQEDLNLPIPIKVLTPHKWHGQLLGGGDPWEWEPWPWGPDPGGDGFTGQLAWVEEELSSAHAEDKGFRAVFLHHDPLKDMGSPPDMWEHPDMYGFFVASGGKGEGSQALMYLMRKYEVDTVVSGHAHSDHIEQVDWAPFSDSSGKLLSINTSAAEIPVDGKSLLLDGTAEKYCGYRLMTTAGGQLDSWGFAGADGDPDTKWSIPGWENLQVGAGAVNDFWKYRENRPVIQWMEQEQSSEDAYLRPPITDGEGALDRELPLNEKGPFSDVTCKVKNTLNQPGAVLNLTECRVEFPMAYLDGGEYYSIENGALLEQYDTDSGDRMMVVNCDVPGGDTVPVTVSTGGTDLEPPVITEAMISNGDGYTNDLEVNLKLEAVDDDAGLMDYMVSNDEGFDGAQWIPYTGGPLRLPWTLDGEDDAFGPRSVYVAFRDAAMPGNVATRDITINYDLGKPTGSVIINDGDATTEDLDVELALEADDESGIQSMKVGNQPDLSGAEWEPYSPEMEWTIEPRTDGGATVFVQYQDTVGRVSDVYSDNIVHVTLGLTSPIFYFAEGTCRPGFDPYLTIQNPNPGEADVTVTYMLGNSTTETQTLTVPGNTRSTVTVKETLGEGDDPAHDFSAMVECTNALEIICERPMYFNYKPGVLDWDGGSDVVGALAPADTFYFAEGTCRPGFDPYLTIQNPNPGEADVTVTYMLGNSTTETQTLTVPGNTRSTVTVKETLGEGDDPAHDFSAMVECTNALEIICERPMYFNYKPGVLDWDGGSDVVGALAPADTFYFAEGTCRPGFDPYLTIQNPNPGEADVTVTYMLGNSTTETQTLTVPGNTRSTVTVKETLGEGDDPAHDFSAMVECTNALEIICERPMYFNYKPGVLDWDGGSDVVGALAPADTFYFAEGTCRPGFDPYLTIQNPNPGEADVTVTYMLGNSTTETQTLTVPGNTRSTVTVKETLGEGDDPAHDFSAMVECTNALEIICERPMYFNYKPGVLDWDGGSDVVGL